VSFQKYPGPRIGAPDKTNIQRQTDAIDAQIDKLVYEL
jgi:hypothetical protein